LRAIALAARADESHQLSLISGAKSATLPSGLLVRFANTKNGKNFAHSHITFKLAYIRKLATRLPQLKKETK